MLIGAGRSGMKLLHNKHKHRAKTVVGAHICLAYSSDGLRSLLMDSAHRPKLKTAYVKFVALCRVSRCS